MAKKYISEKDESVRIFRSDFLEFFTHVHPLVPHLIFVPVIGAMLFLAASGGVAPAKMLLLFCVGTFLWTLVEYLVHRFLFHATPEIEEEVRRILGELGPREAAFPRMRTLRQRHYFLAHGVHHDYPNDSRRLVMPPSLSIPLALLFYALFAVVFGTVSAPPAFAGFLLGYLVYDTIHYAVHHLSLRSRLLLFLKKKHLRHHFQDSRRDFGVSSAIWDRVVGT
jgi:sterol desaturase/sphingolipid hydroxylase (fatty acid hydroxylase superfamily)